MPQFQKLISTPKGFLNFLVCPTYFSAVSFLFIIIWQGRETLSIFSALEYVLQTKKLEIKGVFFSRKSQQKIISDSPRSISILLLCRDLGIVYHIYVNKFKTLKHSKIDHSFLQNVSLNSITLFVTTLFM